jgi:hypothetical protein
MKLSKIVCPLLAIVVALLTLGLSVEPTAAGGSPLRLVCGSYSSIFSGNLVAAGSQPFAGTGLFVSDCKGDLIGHETFNLNGTTCGYQINGTYTVAADGTGSDAIDYINGATGCPSGNYTQSLAVVDGGASILLSNTNSSDVATEHWYRAKQVPQSGACCLGDAGQCFHTDNSLCEAAMGIFRGVGTACSARACAPK